ncbi:hypothetical protein CCP3SC15_150006 [Gammaproteobacteria bacterium]
MHPEPLKQCIEERNHLREKINDHVKESVPIRDAVTSMQIDIGYIKEKVVKIETILEEKYVTKADFVPVQRIVYGMVGVILIGVLTAVITLVLKGH